MERHIGRMAPKQRKFRIIIVSHAHRSEVANIST